MNFYEAQDDARRRTKLLVFYFVMALIGVVMAIYTILGLFYMTQTVSYTDGAGNRVVETGAFWDLERFATIAILTTGVILAGNAFKSLQLSGGGSVVARDMGGRQVDPHTTDTDERKLMNVVEEMAIASGVPVPEVWVMDHEPSINAFAAGTEPGNAVIGVTRGCIQRLTRSELQGVIAHEFSHILNGDMKLNMRLIGWLFGIMMLSIIGRELLFHMQFVRIRGSRENNNGALIGLVAAIALLVVGAIGVFFARMIQAAISRQREYLADASAVQFTRDPSGIAGALKKIGGQEYGSEVKAGKASEASHMFFADGGMFSYGFATHPPLKVRIKAIEGDWDGKFKPSEIPEVAAHGGYSQDSRMSGFAGGGESATPPPVPSSVGREEWGQLGESSQTRLEVGASILRSMEDEWIEACHDRDEAQAMIFGLLLAVDRKLVAKEVKFLKKKMGEAAAERAQVWSGVLSEQHSSQKIALVDLSIPTLRKLSRPEYERFMHATQWLMASDGQVDIFEFMLQKVLENHLSVHYEGTRSERVRYHKLGQIVSELNILVSTMAGIGAANAHELQEAYGQAADALAEKGARLPGLLPAEECGLNLVDEALSKLAQSTPVMKRDVLYACGLAVMSDGELGSQEVELLRAAADTVGAAIPPFVKV
ncbi:M48 family metallopeptidase [Rubritalea tangerina]|uniref:M48 family metallopeptidase n=1 Tax=Rubritalea tangerina TaxID=430798 RepID=A0ABW4Z9G5_9BACT